MELQEDFTQILNAIKSCKVQEFIKNFDEVDYKNESARDTLLNLNISYLIGLLHKCKIRDNNLCYMLSSIYFLYIKLKTKGPWNSGKTPDYASTIQNTIQDVYNIDLETFLFKKSICDRQVIFDGCMQEIHRNLSQENYKKFPSIIEVYCAITSNIEYYDVKINPMTTLPLSLILIQDYEVENKIKGLICCNNIYKSLSASDFTSGNYYDVFFETLYKQLPLNNLDVTSLVLKCLLEVIRISPEDKKENKCDECLMHILNEIYIMSNLVIKRILFSSLIKLISIHQINSARRKKKLFMVIQENLDLCVDKEARSIIFNEVVEILMIWLKYCWSLWKYSEDKKILSTLFKILYAVNDKETDLINKINSLITLLFKLSLKDEQQLILSSLDLTCHKIEDTIYLSKLENIRKLCVK